MCLFLIVSSTHTHDQSVSQFENQWANRIEHGMNGSGLDRLDLLEHLRALPLEQRHELVVELHQHLVGPLALVDRLLDSTSRDLRLVCHQEVLDSGGRLCDVLFVV